MLRGSQYYVTIHMQPQGPCHFNLYCALIVYTVLADKFVCS